jgi:hypothetical protein
MPDVLKLEKKVNIGPQPLMEWERAPATQIRVKYQHYQEYLKRIPALRAEPVPIAIDEWVYMGSGRTIYSFPLRELRILREDVDEDKATDLRSDTFDYCWERVLDRRAGADAGSAGRPRRKTGHPRTHQGSRDRFGGESGGGCG